MPSPTEIVVIEAVQRNLTAIRKMSQQKAQATVMN
jgi:hypothetical protein